MAKRPLEIDMCSSSQLRDTQGEMLSVEGADISELLAGRGRLNDNHGKGFFNTLGKVTAAKKIFKREDCEDDRQRYYWDKVKSPYIYVKGELFDDEDHPNAKAAAAILRNIHKSDCPLKLKASVEGGVVARGISDPGLLARTKIHSVALTFVPANQATLVEPLNLDKSADVEADMILIKSVMHLAQTSVPSFRHITRDASAAKVEENIKAIMQLMGDDTASVDLKKALIEESLELKIAENVKRIHELVKGAMRRVAPFNPDDVSLEDRKRSYGYVSNEDPEGNYNGATPPSKMEGTLRTRALHRLHSLTQTRRNPKTNEREFLLHRGVTEEASSPEVGLKSDGTYIHGTGSPVSSWTWDQKVADSFAGHNRPDYPETFTPSVSAWIPESQIHHMPHMIGSTAGAHKDIFSVSDETQKPKVDRAMPKHEKEVIIDHTKPVTVQAVRVGPSKEMQKALTAGYGGAGSPMSLTGGGVMQSESLDVGPKSLRYITCDNCGKEQVYGKFQVKCRECSKAFPMAKLENFFRINKG